MHAALQLIQVVDYTAQCSVQCTSCPGCEVHALQHPEMDQVEEIVSVVYFWQMLNLCPSH